MLNQTSNLHKEIKKFLDVYSVLAPEAKAQFEAKLAGEIKNLDERTKKLYRNLLSAAKDGKGIEEAIEGMNRANAG